jgi:hypothetical protein
MKKYLLPCHCGHHVEVDAGQAGLTVACACGAMLEVPTMRGLSTLAVAESKDAAEDRERSAWGPGQGLLFLGTIATICGVIALGLVLRTRPQWHVQTEQIAIQVDQLTTAQLWERWQALRKGLSSGDDPVRQQFDAHWSTYRRRRTMAAIPVVLGVLLIGAGFALRSRSQT